jgi:tetratricopeptide (TPR) repeat protein
VRRSVFRGLVAVALFDTLVALAAAAEAPRLPAEWSALDRHYYEAWGLPLDDADAYYRFGAELQGIGRVDEAMTALNAALALDPAHTAAHAAVGLIMLSKGEPEQAAAHFEAVIAAGPGPFEAGAHTRLGKIKGRLGQREEARAHFERAVELNPERAETRFNLALAYERDERPLEAILQLQAAVEANPDFAVGRRKLAGLLRKQGRHAEAVPHYEALIEANERDPVALYDLASAFEALGQPERARQTFERSLEVARSSPRYRKMARDLEVQLYGKASEPRRKRRPRVAP